MTVLQASSPTTSQIGRPGHRADSRYKKDNGIFYTHPTMARLILEQLQASQDDTILDPCCGMGSFLLAARQLGYSKLFGADIHQYAVEQCKELTGVQKVRCMDTLGNDADSILRSLGLRNKPDLVVGNPPYAPIAETVSLECDDTRFCERVKLLGNNLFVAALIRAFELVREGGIVSYIIPKNFLHVSSYSRYRGELLKQATIISIVDIGAYFRDVRGEQVVITFRNTPPQRGHRIAFMKFDGLQFAAAASVAQGFYKDEILAFHSDHDHAIYQKLRASHATLGDFCDGSIRRGRSRSQTAVSGKDLRKFGYKERPLPKTGDKVFLQNIYSTEAGIIGAFGGHYEASETITMLVARNEDMCRYALGILHSRLCNFFLYKYCYNNSKLTMHTDAKYLAKIPFLTAGYRDAARIVRVVRDLEDAEYLGTRWFELVQLLNGIVYAVFGLTGDEVNYIDSEMRRIQSRKWVR